jgi:hypothetical protein
MYSYDHDLSTFVAIGTATVTDDGAILRSDPGVGVLKAGWHCGGNPNQTGAAATCPQCNKCIGTNCAPDPAAATCDDKDKCTENDKCISGACKGTPVDLSKFREDSTFGAEVTLPRGVVDKANQALHFIPGLGGVNFKEATVGFSGQAKDCCDKNTGKIDYGIKEGSLSVSLSADIKGLTLWGPPSISKEFDFGIAVAQIDFAAGVVFDSNFSLSAEGGLRKNECKNETCAFGQLSGSATGTLKATVEGIFCIETWWTSKVCGGLTITPASISISVSAALTYNKPECNSGFGGNITIGKVVFKAKFAVGVPGAAELSFEYEILSGIKIGG